MNGGGLFDTLGTSTLTDCTFSGNSASVNGGGLFTTGGTTTLTNCTVSGNSAAVNGGGLYNNGGTTIAAPTARSAANSAVSGNAQAAAVQLSGTTTLTDVTVSGNSAEQRRRPVQLQRHDHADQRHCQRQLRRRTAAACPTYDGTTTLTDCTVSGNSASSGDGGGVFNDLGTTTLLNCSVSGNSAAVGGGLATYYYGTTTLTNCTVSGNSAASDGGGVDTEQ